MANFSHNLDLTKHEDQKELFEHLAAVGVQLDAAALQYALSVLTEDWFQLTGSFEVCSLKVGSKHSEAIGLATWSHVIQSVYDFRNHKSFDTQIHRLRIASHEKLDTVLVLLVARRYHQRGFAVVLEPFGESSTDLLISRDAHRLYTEIKRENPREHRRLLRMQEIGSLINGGVDAALSDWLRKRQMRLEVRISKLFSNPHAKTVVEEICASASRIAVGVETELQSVSGSRMIVLPKDAEFFYRKGLHAGFVRVGPETPVPILAPASSPIRCTFGFESNLKALGERIREAGKQLARDLKRDEEADGFVVLECVFGNENMVDAIQKRFWSRLPARCWGVTLISNSGWIIPRYDLSTEQTEILKYAALDLPPTS
jgi:hypothetical protein